MATEAGALEFSAAGRVEPAVDAPEMQTTAVDGRVAVHTRRPFGRSPLLTVPASY